MRWKDEDRGMGSLEEMIAESLSAQADALPENQVREDALRARTIRQIEEETIMKNRNWNWKKVAVTAAMVCVLGSVTAVAAGKFVGVSGSSDKREEFTSYQEIGEVGEEYGIPFSVRAPEQFENGFAFESGRPVHESGIDAEGNETELPTSITLVYTKDGMPEVTLSESKTLPGVEGGNRGNVHSAGGVDYYYTLDTYKFVPPSYEVSAEEQAAMDAGELYISYGSDEVTVNLISTVIWEKDGVTYDLLAFDTPLTEEEMVGMAQEVME